MATENQIAKRSRDYGSAEIERGLAAVALVQGDTRKAAEVLKAEGLPIPRSTLKRWQTQTHRDRYLAISNEELHHTYARIAEGNEALAERLLKLGDKAVDKLESRLEDEDLSADKLSNALRNIAVSIGITIDKGSVIRGRPTEIREDRNVADIVRTIEAKFGHVVDLPNNLKQVAAIDSTAEEVEE